MMKNRLGFISFAQCIGCLLVVLGHSYPLNIESPYVMDRLQNYIYVFHMPLFFFISGYLLVYSNSIEKRGYYKFIVDKGLKLLSPYLFLSLVGFLPKYAMVNFISDKVILSHIYFVEVFFKPRTNIWGHFWFLPTLFIMFAFSKILMLTLKNKLYTFIVSLGLIYLAVCPIEIEWFSIKDVTKFAIYYWLGMLVSMFVSERISDFLSLKLAVLIIPISMFTILLPLNWTTPYIYLIVAVIMIYSIISLGMVYQNNENKWFNWLKGKTYPVFLLSWPAQAVVEVIGNKILHLNWYLVFVLMFITGVLIPLMFIWIYNKIDKERKYSFAINVLGM